MVSTSGYINRLVIESNAEKGPGMIEIDNLPGGAKMFELVMKFSYGMKINLTAANIGPLYCAANFLEMSEDLKPGNLISVAEAFMSYVILSSWKGTFRILKSCETISSWAKDLQVLRQCAESIAWKVCREKNSNDFFNDEMFMNLTREKEQSEDWWFEDVSSLRIDHFIELIAAVKRKKIKPEIVGSCIAHWTRKWLSQITITNKNLNHKSLAVRLHRVTAENIIRMIPAEANSISCNFLLHLFKIGLVLQVNSGLLNQLERRIAFGIENCKATDLLIRNSLTLFDVDVVTKVVQTYVSSASSNLQSKISVVGRLMDEYLMLVARDVNLPATSFQLLIEALPRSARSCNDNLYRAIDMYLKVCNSCIDQSHITECLNPSVMCRCKWIFLTLRIISNIHYNAPVSTVKTPLMTGRMTKF